MVPPNQRAKCSQTSLDVFKSLCLWYWDHITISGILWWQVCCLGRRSWNDDSKHLCCKVSGSFWGKNFGVLECVCCVGRVRGFRADRAKPVGFEYSQNSLLRASTDSCEWCTLLMWAYVLECSSAVHCDRAQHQPVEHPGTCTGLKGSDGWAEPNNIL